MDEFLYYHETNKPAFADARFKPRFFVFLLLALTISFRLIICDEKFLRNSWLKNCFTENVIFFCFVFVFLNDIQIWRPVIKVWGILISYALSFYVTKTVLVGPKWFWFNQIDFDLTIMIWSRPKWNGHDQNEMVRTKMNCSGPNVIHYGRKSQFGPDQFILGVTISF